MKRRIILLLLIILAIAGGCASKTVKPPFASEERRGYDYDKTVGELSKAGFTNVNGEPVATKHKDLVGTVDTVKIDGKTDYKKTQSFPENVTVVVRYYKLLEGGEGGSISFFR